MTVRRWQLHARIRLVLPALLTLSGLPASAQNAVKERDVWPVLQRLTIDIPGEIERKPAIARGLDELAREPCDKTAIFSLGKALEAEGYRRESAKAHIRYSETCSGYAPSLREAANVMMRLTDYAGMIKITNELIKLEPFNDNGFFLRGYARFQTADYGNAIDDLATSIDLFANKPRMSSIGFVTMAQAYDKLGQPCNAIAPIETWIHLNAAQNDSSRARAMIASYVAKGNCPKASGKEASFPISRPGQVQQIQVTINGVKGNFLLDTGATFVALKRSFATRAKVDVEENSSITMSTANGLTTARRGTAKTVEARTLKAENVQIIVQTDDKASYGGASVDGLLGMSFLSRFQMTMDNKSITLRTR